MRTTSKETASSPLHKRPFFIVLLAISLLAIAVIGTYAIANRDSSAINTQPTAQTIKSTENNDVASSRGTNALSDHSVESSKVSLTNSSTKKREALMSSSPEALSELAPVPSFSSSPDERSRMIQRSERAKHLNDRLQQKIERLLAERETATEDRKQEIDRNLVILERNRDARARRYLPASISERE
ncbi:MAG: hypothetical protein JXX29_02215 [Deltaproteobacteria bacterium]|nr:hypothetical protein [Deltaproteobacteria bacterium]MBN2670457.1 hypothetical protein [Deltaproteobacteria bacterium]